MLSQYDENLCENPFFKEIRGSHNDIIDKASRENWIICVPRIGTFEPSDILMETILDHILVPGAEHNFCTLSKKQVGVRNKRITVDSSQLFTNNVEILFEEIFYMEKIAKYTVWCIDRPLFIKHNCCFSHNSLVIENLHDCIDFLWAETLGHDVLDNIKSLSDSFMQKHEEFISENLQTQKEEVGSLYSRCLQSVLKSEVIKEKTKSVQFLENFKVSVETYMQYCLGRKLMFSVNTLQYQTDLFINKIIRNSSDLQFQDLNIPNNFSDVIISAKCQLNRLNNYVTVLDKIYCLNQTFNIIYQSKSIDENDYITADDILQILVFLILKLNINNWAANLVFIKEFRLSLIDNSDRISFFITCLEAAIEFIKSNKFLEIRNNSYLSRLSSSQIALQNICDQITAGKVTPLKTNNKVNYIHLKLCHPLCSCKNCEGILKTNETKDFKNNNEQNENFLVNAAILGDCDILEFLLGEGFEINSSDFSGKTSLHYAASKGHQDILLLLINKGANINAIDNDKNTPLHLASNNGHENCVKALIYSSRDIKLNLENSFGETPLHFATKWGYLDIIKILLENGASTTIKNKRNQTVLNLAPNYYVLRLFEKFEVENSQETSDKLKDDSCISEIDVECKNVSNDCQEHGLKPKKLDEFKKIDLLLKAIESNDLPLTCFYLGFSYNTSNIEIEKSSCHPLCDCENCQKEQNMEFDVPKKTSRAINVNMCNSSGYTPLHISSKYGRTDILRLLLDCGALPNVQTYKTLYSPLHLACIYQRIQIVRELLKCGDCKVDIQDAKGNTPLFYACIKNDIKIVEILLLNGADCTKKNHSGISPLLQSEENMQYRVFKLLKNSLVNILERENIQDVICDDDALF